MATTHFPIVLDREASGVFSAYVVGLPVYAQGASAAQAARAIRRTLLAYLAAHPDTPAAAARANGRLGGRPRLSAAAGRSAR